ncbi:MAG: hypothetical protein NTV89_14705, partial [Proteobacteria bacterium]|nr:hypothetical protein [Pseudomonadota bacterium]
VPTCVGIALILDSYRDHCDVLYCTPHSSGFRAPCIWMFLTSLGENYFFNNLLHGMLLDLWSW